MKIVFAVLVLFFPIKWVHCQSNIADEYQQIVDNYTGRDRLDEWNKLFKSPLKDEIIFLDANLHIMVDYSKKILGEDSAAIWKFRRQKYLIDAHQSYGNVERAVEILDEMKSIVDSLIKKSSSFINLKYSWHYYAGKLYYTNSDMDLAEKHLKIALQYFTEIEKHNAVFTIYAMLIRLHSYTGTYQEALKYEKLTSLLLTKVTIPVAKRYDFYYTKAYLYGKTDQPQKEHEYLQMVLDSIHLFDHGKNLINRVQIDYGKSLCKLGRVNEGLEYFENLHKRIEKSGELGNLKMFAEGYSDALILLGRNKEAVEWANKARDYYDLIQEARRTDELQEWQTKYEVQEKEAKIQLLKEQQQNSTNQMIILGLSTLIILIVLSFLVYRNKIQKQQLVIKLRANQEIMTNRNRLFSSISHDIRTPLSLILGPLEKASKEVFNHPAETKNYIDLARKNSVRLMELFNQILDWNKAEAKALVLNQQVGQFKIVFDILCERYKQLAQERNRQFESEIILPIGQYIMDFDKLDKIVSNLVGNAIKFCDEDDKIKLTAHLNSTDSEGKLLVLIVEDNGPGITEEDKDILFMRHKQGKQGQLKGGTGIGLALVKELVHLMHGKITVNSEKEKGTLFQVLIPIEKVKKSAFDPIENEEFVEHKNKPSILIVEDEPELLSFLEETLKQEFKIETANTTVTGLNIAVNTIPDLIISDWTLPDHNGGWLCRELVTNELTSHIPVMILTAHSNHIEKTEALNAGAIAWMNKPFNIDVLFKQLHSILNQQQNAQRKWRIETHPLSANELHQKLSREDIFMKKVLEDIEKNYHKEDYSVVQLAENLFLSRVQLYRKVKKISGNGPGKLIGEYRVKKAKVLLNTNKYSVSEIAYMVGFSDPNYFGKVYKQYYHISPSSEH